MFAGNYRPAGVEIQGSRHEPVGAHLVPELVEGLCDYVNENWEMSTPIHLSSYVMWRLNWIHPFADGNGRTSRIVSYVVLSILAGVILPGTPTIPDQIVDNRNPYFDALDAADVSWKDGRVDVSKWKAYSVLCWHNSWLTSTRRSEEGCDNFSRPRLYSLMKDMSFEVIRYGA
jgi:Fic family protein